MARATRAAAGLSKLTLQDLQAEMFRRRKKLDKLQRQRNTLTAKVEKIDAQIGEFESLFAGTPARGPGRPRGTAKRGRGRPRAAGKAKAAGAAPKGRAGKKKGEGPKPGTLAGALYSLLQGKTMRVKDAVVGIQQAGYKTGAANLRTMVNQALGKHKHLFKKQGRGKYTSI